jgi:NAD(P)-dependent dehydrogenase (short-subunit alcohol dehydrogenase family)
MDQKQTAIITGAAQGIGKATTLAFLEHGYQIVGVDNDREAMDELSALLDGEPAFSGFFGDIVDERTVAGLIGHAAHTFGRIDCVINNAGVMRRAPVTRLRLEDWNRVIGVNLTAPFLLVKHAAPLLRQNGGSIINIASTRALMSEADTEAYAASKGGLVALTHAMAISFGPQVRVNCISPGWIETGDWKKASVRAQPRLSPDDHGQHPCGRVGTPDDIARAALFCADPANGFLTGAHIVLDGGMTRKMIYVE